MKPMTFVLSCEHAVNSVPEEYRSYFAGHEALLSTHRGIDFGALSIAQTLSRELQCPLIAARCSRLVIDCNRILSHAKPFSEISKAFSKEEKQAIIARYYQPFRDKVIQTIEQALANNEQVWHLSIHSFVPVLSGVERNADIGLLYDPKRGSEKRFVQDWKGLLKKHSQYRIRKNYPYLGISDGFTTYLRKCFPEERYVGIEVEINQVFFNRCQLDEMGRVLVSSLQVLRQRHKLS